MPGPGACRFEFGSDDGQTVLIVADDGVGFDSVHAAGAGHEGLGNMQARADAIGATLQIEGVPGEGTRIIVGLPSRASDET
jgi:signal transduction histidine kinase